MTAVKYHSSRTARGWDTYLEVEFTDRAGQAHLVTGPIAGPHLVTSSKPRAKGVLHTSETVQARLVCAAVGVEFWAVSDAGPRTYWATAGGCFYLVRHDVRHGQVQITAVDTWGAPDGGTYTHTAPEGLA